MKKYLFRLLYLVFGIIYISNSFRAIYDLEFLYATIFFIFGVVCLFIFIIDLEEDYKL